MQSCYGAAMATAARGLRADAARNLSLILDTAAQVLEDNGPAVSLEETARRTGVGVATLYRRFRTRDDLITAVAEHVFAAEVATAVSDGGPDAWEDLVATLRATLEAFAAHPVLVSLARESAVIDLHSKTDYIAAIQQVLDRARDCGAVRAELTVEDLTAMVFMSLTMMDTRGREGSRRYLALLIDGMRPTGRALPPTRRRGAKAPCSRR